MIFNNTNSTGWSGLYFQNNSGPTGDLYQYYNATAHEMTWGGDFPNGLNSAFLFDIDLPELTSSTNGGFVIGAPDGVRLTMDANEIEAKYSVGNDATLFINYYGGDIWLGEDFTVNDSTGNVGIGTNSPTEKLELSSGNLALNSLGDIYFGDATNNVLYAFQTSASGIELDCAGGNYSVGLDVSGTGTVYFNTDNGARSMTITQIGFVGIGVPSPDRILHISTVGKGTGAVCRNETDDNTDAKYEFWEAGVEYWEFGMKGNAAGNPFRIAPELGAGSTTSQKMEITTDGKVGIGRANPSLKLEVAGAAGKTAGGATWNVLSDRRLKTNIEEFEDGLDVIMKMRPVSFQYNDVVTQGETSTEEVGIIAQEMQEIAPYMIEDLPITTVKYEGEGESAREIQTTETYLSYNANALLYILVNSIQEQQGQIEEQQEQIEEKDAIISDLMHEMNAMKEAIAEIRANMPTNTPSDQGTVDLNTEKNVVLTGQGRTAELAQNQPNPFNENTVIKYFLPDGTTGAQMNIFDSSGKLLKTVKIDEVGEGQINLQANSLPSGNYSYQLSTDTGVIGTKTMVLVK